MNELEVRRDWTQFRDEVNRIAVASKQSQAALSSLFDRYEMLSDGERCIINKLLADELLSEDESARFDALAIIRKFRIKTTLPALRELARELESQNFPGAPYEWKKVNRLIGLLSQN